MGQFMFYTIYKVTNTQNGKIYIGKHQTENLDDDYLGSGTCVTQAIKKYGFDAFRKEILFIFDSEEEMNAKEAELVTEEFVADKSNYNLCPGGKGGWGYVNQNHLNSGDLNIMRIDLQKKKEIIEKAKLTRATNKDYYDNISRKNFLKASEMNRGKNKPRHSEFMSKIQKQKWNENREEIRNTLSSWFELIDPHGNEYKTNRLQEFCNDKNLIYSSIWNTSISCKPVSKGKCKGWICKKISAP
tara:strand:- start:2168 stop:2896 length:729 start_codon:yes stop_codon:yes gene_type:complete